MQELKDEILLLKNNVAAMVELIALMRKNEIQCRQEIGQLKSENANLEEKIRFLEEKTKLVGMASAVDPEKRSEMKQKIKELVREIDGCIAMIKN